MTTGKLDFEGLAAFLLSRANTLIPQWLPSGRQVGREWTCGSIHGDPGDSFKVNTETGFWAEFNNNQLAGRDLISLRAAQLGIDNGEAYKQLAIFWR